MNENQLIKIKKKLKLKKSKNNKSYDLSKKQLEQRFNISINQIIKGFNKVPSFVDAQKSLKKNETYKIIVPKNIRKQLENGSATWNIDKTGLQLPMIKNRNGSFICQARLEEIKPAHFENINNIALQTAMANVLEQLEEISEQVTSVLQGQFTDRVGIIKGAEETYRQALLTKDPILKKQLLSQAITELNRGRGQLIESLENKTRFIDNLPDSSFKQFIYSMLHKINTNKIEIQFIETQDIFDSIISSSYYLALAYEELGEEHALKESLLPLKECLKKHSKKIAKVSEFLPYNPNFENEKSWYKNSDEIINEIDLHLNDIYSNDKKYIEIEVSGDQLLNSMEE